MHELLVCENVYMIEFELILILNFCKAISCSSILYIMIE